VNENLALSCAAYNVQCLLLMDCSHASGLGRAVPGLRSASRMRLASRHIQTKSVVPDQYPYFSKAGQQLHFLRDS